MPFFKRCCKKYNRDERLPARIDEEQSLSLLDKKGKNIKEFTHCIRMLEHSMKITHYRPTITSLSAFFVLSTIGLITSSALKSSSNRSRLNRLSSVLPTYKNTPIPNVPGFNYTDLQWRWKHNPQNLTDPSCGSVRSGASDKPFSRHYPIQSARNICQDWRSSDTVHPEVPFIEFLPPPDLFESFSKSFAKVCTTAVSRAYSGPLCSDERYRDRRDNVLLGVFIPLTMILLILLITCCCIRRTEVTLQQLDNEKIKELIQTLAEENELTIRENSKLTTILALFKDKKEQLIQEIKEAESSNEFVSQ